MLRYPFGYLLWYPRILRGTRLKAGAPGYVHINSLEMIVVSIQLAAVMQALQHYPQETLCGMLSGIIPAEPILLAWCDNTSATAWAHKATSKSLQGQNLVKILAEMLLLTNVGLSCTYISSKSNDLADFISRHTSKPIQHVAHCEQIYQKAAHMRNWRFFLPSPELSQLLSSALFSAPWAARPSLPKSLGQFVPDASTTSCSPIL